MPIPPAYEVRRVFRMLANLYHWSAALAVDRFKLLF